MSLFASVAKRTIGVVVDIGSASVLVQIVSSVTGEAVPKLIWTHREFVPLREAAGSEQAGKNLLTSLMSATMEIETVGQKILQQTIPGARITELYVTIAAPWSYTVTKTITYVKEESFTISDTLLKELLEAAQKKVAEEMKESQVTSQYGLKIIASKTTEVLANGYAVKTLAGQRATSVVVSRTNSVTQEYLVTALEDLGQKAFPRTELQASSFMYAYYSVVKQLHPDWQEYCLIDVTYEATEIGMVREGVLRFCTHTATGVYSLARALSKITGAPLDESLGRLGQATLVATPETKEQTEKISNVASEYEKIVTELLRETGDALSIPKSLLIHCALPNDSFMQERLTAAAGAVTKSTHHVVSVTKDIIEKFHKESDQKELLVRHDMAALVSAQYFHNCQGVSDDRVK